MRHKILVLLFFILASGGLYAQKETSNWFFGNKAGLTWNTTQTINATGYHTTPNTALSGMPTPLSGSAMNTTEGCFSISNSAGELLFYSDGITIWNRNHDIMENGLTGHSSSAQSGIILPYPGSPNKYVAVSQPAVENVNQNNISYSVIDMTQGGGLGAVTLKNQPLPGAAQYICETVSTIKHANGKDYWIVAFNRSPAISLYAWAFTENGPATSPVVTPIPSINPFSTTSAATGYLEFSPDRKHFALGTWVYSHLIFGDFDASTGTFSNIKYIEQYRSYSGTGHGPYGIEFTADGKYLYTTIGYSSPTPTLSVFDFNALMAAPATANGVVAKNAIVSAGALKEYYLSYLLGTPLIGMGAIQLAPDGRMYIDVYYSTSSSNMSNTLVIVNNPNDFNDPQIYTVPNLLLTGMVSRLGLPSFSASWWDLNIGEIEPDPVLPVCKGTEITFSATFNTSNASDLSEVSKVVWSFGDGNTATDVNIIPTLVQTHTYAEGGKYTLTLIPYDENDKELTDMIKTMEVKISPCVIPVNPNVHLWR